jgi:hypothetical protein
VLVWGGGGGRGRPPHETASVFVRSLADLLYLCPDDRLVSLKHSRDYNSRVKPEVLRQKPLPFNRLKPSAYTSI